GIAGSHVRGINTHGGLAFTRAREIGREEIRMAVDKARAIPLPPDRDVLHLLPQEFILDEQHGVHDPLGMIATRLEVRVHMISAARSAAQNVDRKSTRLNSSHRTISYAVFCLKKKKTQKSMVLVNLLY